MLVSLNLENCGLQAEHATRIGEALLDNSKLVQLNLRGMRLFRDLTSVGVEYHALVNSITVDNMLPDTINPLVLRSGLSTTAHFTADDVEHAQEPAAAAVDLERVPSPAPRSSFSMLLPGRGPSAQSRGEDGVGEELEHFPG